MCTWQGCASLPLSCPPPRLRAELAPLTTQGITDLPGGMQGPATAADLPLDGGRFRRSADMAGGRTRMRWLPDVVLVVEGAARSAAAGSAAAGSAAAGSAGVGADAGGAAGSPVRIVAAPGSGDDTIADLALSIPGRRIVVTADRELRHRSTEAGASVAGPRWLFGQL
jgi:hypothetical protein